MILIFSSGIKKIPHLDQFLGQPVQFLTNAAAVQPKYCPSKAKAVAGWGRKKSYFIALKYAKKNNLSVLTLEDGFVRSIGLGVEGCAPLGVVIDDLGIYFDAHYPSRLERLINQQVAPELLKRARHCIDFMLKHGISKYNQTMINNDPLPINNQNRSNQKQNILVVDQTLGDESIAYAGGSATSFQQMLDYALSQYPEANIYLKVHPDVVAAKKKGHFELNQLPTEVIVLADNTNPMQLLNAMDKVFVVSSHIGFEALMLTKEVVCFAMPWYAGWGLTNDQFAPQQLVQARRTKRTVEHLFVAAYLKYTHYVHPHSKVRCELEEILYLIKTNMQWQTQLKGAVYCFGFSRWKKKFLRQYLNFTETELRLGSKLNAINLNAARHVISWGNKQSWLRLAGHQTHWRMEDGFIRSIGLGAKLIAPCSIVLDDIGIYYDARFGSRLEQQLLAIESLNEMQLKRIGALKSVINQQQISKYNLDSSSRMSLPSTKKNKILVPGQVEDDASIQLGTIDIRTNLSLLKVVRENNPEACIVYKPHPDVVAGLRAGVVADEEVDLYADHAIDDIAMPLCLDWADEVHTMTSLTGFEALIRNKKVNCYGLPFYAGWGLTHDMYPSPRRNRMLTLEQLLYVSLIEYPIYNIPTCQGSDYTLTTPEVVINDMIAIRKRPTKLHIQILNKVKAKLAYGRFRTLAYFKK